MGNYELLAHLRVKHDEYLEHHVDILLDSLGTENYFQWLYTATTLEVLDFVVLYLETKLEVMD
jgi:hypothetical protein